MEQVLSLGRTTIVQSAWAREQELVIHGLIYGIEDGLLRELDISVANQRELSTAYAKIVSSGL